MSPTSQGAASQDPSWLGGAGGGVFGQAGGHGDAIPRYPRGPVAGSAEDVGDPVMAGSFDFGETRLKPRPVDTHGRPAGEEAETVDDRGHLVRVGPAAPRAKTHR